MKHMDYLNIPIADSHIHIFWAMPLEERLALLDRIMEENNYDTATILTLPINSARKVKSRDFLENLRAFLFNFDLVLPNEINHKALQNLLYLDLRNNPWLEVIDLSVFSSLKKVDITN